MPKSSFLTLEAILMRAKIALLLNEPYAEMNDTRAMVTLMLNDIVALARSQGHAKR